MFFKGIFDNVFVRKRRAKNIYIDKKGNEVSNDE